MPRTLGRIGGPVEFLVWLIGILGLPSTVPPELATRSSGMLVDLSRGELIDNPNVVTCPFPSDYTDHFRIARDRTIDFSDTRGPEGTFLFVNHEGIRQHLHQTSAAFVPDLTSRATAAPSVNFVSASLEHEGIPKRPLGRCTRDL